MSLPPGPLSFDNAKQLLDGLLQRSATDAAFRDLCLADGRAAVQESMGLELPEGVDVVFVDHPGAGAGMVLPPFKGGAPRFSAIFNDDVVVVASDAAPPAATSEPGPEPEDPPPPAAAKPSGRGLNIKPRPATES